MGFELPYIPPGYSPQQVQQAGYAYAQSHGYRGPHMVMQEGTVTYQNGVPGIMVKYVDGQGLSTTEWTPLPQAGPPQQAQSGAMRQPSPAPDTGLAGQAMTAVQGLANQGVSHTPDAQNPKAVAYAKHRLEQLAALGIQYQQYGDPTETWRHASETIAQTAHDRGYDNPRDYLAGKPSNHPIHPQHQHAPQPVGAPDQQHPSAPRGPVDRGAMTRHPRTDVVFKGGIPGLGGDQPQHPRAGLNIREALSKGGHQLPYIPHPVPPVNIAKQVQSGRVQQYRRGHR